MRRLLKTADRWVANHERWIVPLVAAILLAALLAHALQSDISDYGPDGKGYESLGWRAAQAEHLLAKWNFNHAYWSPSWVVTIAALYKIAGRHPMMIRVLLVLCAVGGALLVNRWTRRRGLPALACLMTMVLTVSSTLVFRYIVFYHYEVMLGFGLILFSWLVFRGNRLADEGRSAGHALLVVAGLLFGYLSLLASKVIVLLAVLPVLQLVSARKRHAARTSLVIAAALVVIGGWAARNFILFDEFIPLTTNGGINFYIANNPDATNEYMTVEPDGHRLSESWHFARLALEYIRENPGTTALRMLKKATLFFNPHYGDQAPLMLLFAIGIVRFFRRKTWRFDTEGLWFVTVPLVFMVVHSVFHYEFRYVLPVWPALAWVGAHAFTGWNYTDSPKVPDSPTGSG